MTLKEIIELGLQILNEDHIDIGLLFCWVLSFEQGLHLGMSFHYICPEYKTYTSDHCIDAFLVFKVAEDLSSDTRD